MNRAKTRQQLERHEGRRNQLYDDVTGQIVGKGDCLEGHPTIGVGWNLDARPLPDEVVDRLTNELIQWAHEAACEEPYFHRLNDARQAVVISMIVNLGEAGYRSFRRMRSALRQDEYEDAANEMLDSRWARQVGRRANELAEQMRTGTWDDSIANQ